MTWVPGSQEYIDHLKKQNVCKSCEQHFQSPSNLDHVSRESALLNSRLILVLASNGAFEMID